YQRRITEAAATKTHSRISPRRKMSASSSVLGNFRCLDGRPFRRSSFGLRAVTHTKRGGLDRVPRHSRHLGAGGRLAAMLSAAPLWALPTTSASVSTVSLSSSDSPLVPLQAGIEIHGRPLVVRSALRLRR